MIINVREIYWVTYRFQETNTLLLFFIIVIISTDSLISYLLFFLFLLRVKKPQVTSLSSAIPNRFIVEKFIKFFSIHGELNPTCFACQARVEYQLRILSPLIEINIKILNGRRTIRLKYFYKKQMSIKVYF